MMQDQPQQNFMQDNRGVEYDDMSSELKRWELDPTDELSTLKELLGGIPAKDEKGMIKTEKDNDGNELIVYNKLPAVNRDGAEEIYNFIKQNTTKLISMGYYDKEMLNEMLYEIQVSFGQMAVVSAGIWDMEFENWLQIWGAGRAIIKSTYTRALNGNEKVYRGRTHQTSETKNISEIPQEQQQQRPGVIKRMFRKVI